MGYVFILAQSPVYWHVIVYCRIVTTEVEYMAMTEAMKVTIWLQRLLDDLRIDRDLLKIY